MLPLLHHHQPTPFSLLTIIPLSKPSFFFFFRKPTFSPLQLSTNNNQQYEEEEHVIGDCLVFEEGVFEDPFIQTQTPTSSSKPINNKTHVKQEDLVPANWKDVQAEINITNKQRRKMAQELEFGSKLHRKKQGLKPIPMGYSTVQEFKAAKLKEFKPLVLDDPHLLVEKDQVLEDENAGVRDSRVAPKNPKMAVYGLSFDDISRFLNSDMYDPDSAKDPDGPRKLFTKEEKFSMNRRVPDLAAATSGKWQLYTLLLHQESFTFLTP